MINFCKHLQLNENTDAAFGILQCYVNLFRSPAGAYRPKLIFPLPMLFFKGDNCSTHYSLNIGIIFIEDPQPNLTSRKKNILKREA